MIMNKFISAAVLLASAGIFAGIAFTHNVFATRCDCDPTPTPTPTQVPVSPTVTPTPTEMQQEPTVTPTPTPDPGTPTNPPNVGGPGDGLSDGRSDGRSSCPECTTPPAVGGGQVLGATTDYAATGTSVDMLVNAIGALGGISTAAGLAMIAKKRSH